jgi:hypothetical protein
MSKGTIFGTVTDEHGTHEPIVKARVTIRPSDGQRSADKVYETDQDGKYESDPLDHGTYTVTAEAFTISASKQDVPVSDDARTEGDIALPVGVIFSFRITGEDGTSERSIQETTEGQVILLRAEHSNRMNCNYTWAVSSGSLVEQRQQQNTRDVHWDTNGLRGLYTATLTVSEKGSASITVRHNLTVLPRPVQRIDTVPVTMRRTAAQPTADQALWVAIRNRTRAISFSGSGYKDFIDRVLCQPVLPQDQALTNPVLKRQLSELGSHVHGVGAYDLLKTATETFLLLECGVKIDDALFKADEEALKLGATVSLAEIQDRLTGYLGEGRLPYIRRILRAVFPDEQLIDHVHCYGVLRSRVEAPCLLELIWSYWHEEGMLVQTLNAISLRFQNRRGAASRDPLAHLEIDPLRPLNNLLWGYIQDEYNRLTVRRRAYEYDHHYGLGLYGKAIPEMRPADSRSKFLEGYHNLLRLCSIFYTQDDDTTVIADGFPVLNALKEVHLLLAQGAHNQFGDLPWTARVEMLIQQWLLARPETRDFLQSRAMVPYKEDWMAQVDTMKRLQGWTDVTVTHFRDLGVFGEQILLSIRYGDWIDATDQEPAKNWVRYWRAEIQGYIHAYRAVTGVDLTSPDTVDYTMPSIHLRKRLALQQRSR